MHSQRQSQKKDAQRRIRTGADKNQARTCNRGTFNQSQRESRDVYPGPIEMKRGSSWKFVPQRMPQQYPSRGCVHHTQIAVTDASITHSIKKSHDTFLNSGTPQLPLLSCFASGSEEGQGANPKATMACILSEPLAANATRLSISCECWSVRSPATVATHILSEPIASDFHLFYKPHFPSTDTSIVRNFLWKAATFPGTGTPTPCNGL